MLNRARVSRKSCFNICFKIRSILLNSNVEIVCPPSPPLPTFNHVEPSLQCRRFWWFSSFDLSSVLPPFWIRCRLGELGREWQNVPPTLGKLFTSPQLSTVFLFQDGGLNIRWKYISTRPAKIRRHCRLCWTKHCFCYRECWVKLKPFVLFFQHCWVWACALIGLSMTSPCPFP